MQFPVCGCGAGGTTPWQLPHAASAAPPVQLGAWLVPPAASVAPWQYVLEHRAPSHVGVAPSNLARSEKTRSTLPLACVCTAGTTWQVSQAIGAESTLPVTACFWCAPTARAVVAVSPCVPYGGADPTRTGSAPGTAMRVASPWQVVQLRFTASTTPFMCLSGLTLVRVYPGWQPSHSGLARCRGPGGGTAWQFPHAVCALP